MRLVTQSEFAKVAGVSRQAIRDLYIKGKLRKINNKIDMDCELSRGYLQRRADKSTPIKKEVVHRTSGGMVVETNLDDEGDDGDDFQVEDVGADIGAIISIERMTRRQIERQKLVEQVLAMQVKTAKERKELVSRDSVSKLLAQLAAVDTSELHPLGDSIGAEVAAAFGHDDNEAVIVTKKIIDKRVFRALKHRLRRMEDWLKKIGGAG